MSVWAILTDGWPIFLAYALGMINVGHAWWQHSCNERARRERARQ